MVVEVEVEVEEVFALVVLWCSGRYIFARSLKQNFQDDRIFPQRDAYGAELGAVLDLHLGFQL